MHLVLKGSEQNTLADCFKYYVCHTRKQLQLSAKQAWTYGLILALEDQRCIRGVLDTPYICSSSCSKSRSSVAFKFVWTLHTTALFKKTCSEQQLQQFWNKFALSHPNSMSSVANIDYSSWSLIALFDVKGPRKACSRCLWSCVRSV